MNSSFTARTAAALVLFVFAMPCCVRAQVDPANTPLKEVPIAATSFFLAGPVPSWVEPATIPEGNKGAPLIVRLADTQFLVREAPTGRR